MSKLYESTSHSNPLQFWQGQSLAFGEVADFLQLDKNDLSKISGVSKSSVRLDARIPTQLAESLEQIANICSRVAEYFDGDAGATARWFAVPNPMLGYISPRDMIRLGRYERLWRIVLEAEADNAETPEAA